MTLLELMLVVGLISLVLGIGIGMFASVQPGDRAALGLVQNVLLSARNSALHHNAPARVVIDPDAGTLSAAALRVIGTWHFESEDPIRGAFGLDGVLIGGGRLARGFTGKGLSFEDAPRDSNVEIAVHQDPSYDLRAGFVVELAVRRTDTAAARLLALGETLQLEVDRLGGLAAYFLSEKSSDAGPAEGERIWIKSAAGALPAGQWVRVRLVYDRQRFSALVDGVEVAGFDTDFPVWRVEDSLVLGGGRTPFPGIIDNLVISAVDAEQTFELPGDVRFVPGTPRTVAYAPGGVLDPGVHTEPVQIELELSDGRRQGIRVNLYGTVE